MDTTPTTTSENSTTSTDSVLPRQVTTPISHIPPIQTTLTSISLHLEEPMTDSSLNNLLDIQISLCYPPKPSHNLSHKEPSEVQDSPTYTKTTYTDSQTLSSWTITKTITQSQLWIGDSNISRLNDQPFDSGPLTDYIL